MPRMVLHVLADPGFTSRTFTTDDTWANDVDFIIEMEATGTKWVGCLEGIVNLSQVFLVVPEAQS